MTDVVPGPEDLPLSISPALSRLWPTRECGEARETVEFMLIRDRRALIYLGEANVDRLARGIDWGAGRDVFH